MAPAPSRKLFVNLGVQDLPRSVAFFTGLGFAFNAQFTDDKAACLVVGEAAYFMLLSAPVFRGFTRKTPCDPRTHAEGLYGLSCESRAEVDRLVKAALASGGAPAMPPQDHGFMYGWSFLDPDGHQFDLFWIDPASVPA